MGLTGIISAKEINGHALPPGDLVDVLVKKDGHKRLKLSPPRTVPATYISYRTFILPKETGSSMQAKAEDVRRRLQTINFLR